MEEHDKLSKLFMWSKVKELISLGLNFSQVSRELEMHRQTVAKYASMSYDEFVQSTSYQRQYAHKLDEYEPFVLDLLDRYPFVSAALVHDRLKERYPDLKKVSEKTVFNFVKRLRLTYDIPKEEEDEHRQMTHDLSKNIIDVHSRPINGINANKRRGSAARRRGW